MLRNVRKKKPAHEAIAAMKRAPQTKTSTVTIVFVLTGVNSLKLAA
jgi:hypothetical protein